MESFFVQKKKVILEVVVLLAFFAGMYYLYQMLSVGSAGISKTQANEQLLGANFMLFLKNQENLSFSTSSMNAKLIKQLINHTQVIEPTPSRGRSDPFAPYAATGPVR